MICPKCGVQAGEQDKYCDECGASLASVEAVAPPVTAAQPEALMQPEFYTPKKQKSARYIVFGVLNIIFALVYVFFFTAFIYNLTLPDTSGELVNYNIADLAGNAISSGSAAILLLVGGILLLAGKPSGRSLTLVVLGITVVHFLFVIGLYVDLQARFPSTRYNVDLEGGLLFGRSFGQIVYPFIAVLILPWARRRSRSEFCPNCKYELDIEEASVCHNCGAQIGEGVTS